MAISIIPNQPIQPQLKFINRVPHEYDLMQLAPDTLEQSLQVKCTGATSASYFSFTGATVTGGAVVSGTSVAFTGAATCEKSFTIADNTEYELKLRVQINTLGNIGGFKILINNNEIYLDDKGLTADYSVLQGNLTTYYKIPSGIGATSTIKLQTTGSDTDLTISSVSLTKLSQPIIAALNESKALISGLPSGTFTITTSSAPGKLNYKQIRVKWGNISHGVRYLRISDSVDLGSNMVVNPLFISDTSGWEQPNTSALAEWIYSPDFGGSAKYVVGTQEVISQLISAQGGGFYDFQFTVYGNPLNIGIEVYFEVNGIAQPFQAFYNDTTNSIPLDLSNYTGFPDVRICFRPTSGSTNIYITEIYFKRLLDRNNISVPFNRENGKRNQLTLFGSSLSAANGFLFSSNFDMRLVVGGRIDYDEYPNVADEYTFSNASTDLLSASVEKHYLVSINGSPEYLHDAIRLIRLCDTFLINGESYVAVGGYELKKTDGLSNYAATFKVKEKQGVMMNTY